MTELLDLPTELIIQILCGLDFRSAVRCRELCKLFKECVDTNATLQYTIELAVDGMEDGPPSSLAPANRLQLLREHRAAWKALRHTSYQDIPMEINGVWELYGGVLAQGLSSRGLTFTRLPSQLRGIEQKSWTLNHLDVKIRDFGMDPAQDLLVIVGKPARGSTDFAIHLRSLTSGKPHSAAQKPATLRHSTVGENFSFIIQISGEHLGVLFQSADDNDNELLIWNWKTGVTEMNLSATTQCPFAFLSERHVLLMYASAQNGQNPELTVGVFDFKSAPSAKTALESLETVCELTYPSLSPWSEVLAVSIRSDPSPDWKSPSDLAVPFHRARDERLFVLTAWFAEGAHIKTLLLFLPSSTVLRHVGHSGLDTAVKHRRVPWNEWGPQGTRLLTAPFGHSAVWVCYVYGMSFVSVMAPQHPGQSRRLQVLDFDQLSIRRSLTQTAERNDEDPQIILDTTDIGSKGIFNGVVTTSLPFRRRLMQPPSRQDGFFTAAMLSEDSLIMVYNLGNIRQYRVLNF